MVECMAAPWMLMSEVTVFHSLWVLSEPTVKILLQGLIKWYHVCIMDNLNPVSYKYLEFMWKLKAILFGSYSFSENQIIVPRQLIIIKTWYCISAVTDES